MNCHIGTSALGLVEAQVPGSPGFLVVGASASGACVARARAEAEAAGVADRVHFRHVRFASGARRYGNLKQNAPVV